MNRLAIVVLFALTGCATVPECEDFPIMAMVTPNGPIFLLDADAMAKVQAQMRSLQAGTCRMPKPRAAGTGV